MALTYTLEEGYGSKSVVEGAGFLLNNEMGDFNLVPGRTETTGRIGTPANLIAPRKRMLSSQSPTIVLKDGKVRLVTGSPGGRTIPNTTLWVVLNILEFGMTPREAVDAPEDAPRLVPRRADARRPDLEPRNSRSPHRDGPQAEARRPPGGCPHDRRRPGRHDPRRRRSSEANIQGERGLTRVEISDRRSPIEDLEIRDLRSPIAESDHQAIRQDRELGDDDDLVADHVVGGFVGLDDPGLVDDPDVLADPGVLVDDRVLDH